MSTHISSHGKAKTMPYRFYIFKAVNTFRAIQNHQVSILIFRRNESRTSGSKKSARIYT